MGVIRSFRSIEALARSYYDPFIDKTGELIAYKLLNLDDSSVDWRRSKRNLWKLEQFVVNSKHTKLKFARSRYQKFHQKYLKEGTLQTGKNCW